MQHQPRGPAYYIPIMADPTPIFMPVEVPLVKGVHFNELKLIFQARSFSATLIIYICVPALEIIQEAGGLHKFNTWDRPMLTDSGGFQVHSLAQIRKIKEEGVTFQSHIDGSKHLYSGKCDRYSAEDQRRYRYGIWRMWLHTPANSNTQKKYGDDSSLAETLYHPIQSHGADYDYAQHLFPIVQGSVFRKLRKISAETIASMELEGNAIGGLSVGEPVEYVCHDRTGMRNTSAGKTALSDGRGNTCKYSGMHCSGIDMFDCVMPTATAKWYVVYGWRHHQY